MRTTNADVRWDGFSAAHYVADNFRVLHPHDAIVISKLVEFFAKVSRKGLSIRDVGSGPNLYAVLAALPYAASVECAEFSAANRQYLEGQIRNGCPDFAGAWELLCERSDAYDPKLLELLPRKVEVNFANIYALPECSVDVATMLCVAESITESFEEFELGLKSFGRSVRHDGWYFANFMIGSTGYLVGDAAYPAVKVSCDDVLDSFAKLSLSPTSYYIAAESEGIRPGYDGMLVVYGQR